MRREFDTGELAGWVSGDGPRVLLLHGGPGLSFEYLDWLADELGDELHARLLPAARARALDGRRARSTSTTAVADALAVLDAWAGSAPGSSAIPGAAVLLVHLLLRAPDAASAAW